MKSVYFVVKDQMQKMRFEPLTLIGDSGEILKRVPAPESGWSHEILSQEHSIIKGYSGDVDAFLGGCWIGSTESCNAA